MASTKRTRNNDGKKSASIAASTGNDSVVVARNVVATNETLSHEKNNARVQMIRLNPQNCQTKPVTHTIFPPKDDYFSTCLLYTSPSPRDLSTSRMPSSA